MNTIISDNKFSIRFSGNGRITVKSTETGKEIDAGIDHIFELLTKEWDNSPAKPMSYQPFNSTSHCYDKRRF